MFPDKSHVLIVLNKIIMCIVNYMKTNLQHIPLHAVKNAISGKALH